MNRENESWIAVPDNSDFPLQNIPFGIIKPYQSAPRPATRIGDMVVDLSVLTDFGYFDRLEIPDLTPFYATVLNDFIALGRKATQLVRKRIMELFSAENQELQSNKEACSISLFKANEVKMMLPVSVGDYTDFYSSIEHATNVGMMFRDPANALLPNWRHLPVGYHGRSSSIVVSGAEIHRPKGQIKPAESSSPVFKPSQRLDFELEMAFVTGKDTDLGTHVPVEKAEDYIFGLLIFNDLSARDIQRWEYVPLGPFLSKSFGSVVSPWIVTLEALEPFRTDGPEQYPEALPYLRFKGKRNFDIDLEVSLKPEDGNENLLCHSNFKYMYWNMSQQLAHQTVCGCNIRVGDLYASGTISGPSPDSFGSMLELCWNGTKPKMLSDGTERSFIQDGDTVIMRAYGEKKGLRVGFGDCVVKILPAV